jgi:8-oxo-dGTP diphosphatase
MDGAVEDVFEGVQKIMRPNELWTHYVVGFLFKENTRPDLNHKNKTMVALIRKTRPDWQAGKLNGIGGKMEPGEEAYAAMEREFMEETGFHASRWVPFCDMEYPKPGVVVHCYKARCEDANLNQLTDEKPEWFWVDNVMQRDDLLPNLKWLIPLALDPENKFSMVRG